MKNKITLLSLREIKKSYKRFLSLLIMSFLGVALFVGMINSRNVMLASLDSYYDNNNVYDIKIVSTLGLTNEDVNDLKELDLVEDVQGIHSKDVYFYHDEKTYVIKIYSINDEINKVSLYEGRLPIDDDEIVVETNLLKNNNINIGDYIEINDPENNIEIKKFKIVGTVISPLYLLVGGANSIRGSSNIGSGSVNYYAYAKGNIFNNDYYTEVYLTIKGAKELITNNDKYNELINYGLGEIKAIKKYREKARYDEIYNKVMNEIIEEENKGKKELENANNKLLSYKEELNNGLKKLNNNKIKIENGKIELKNSLIELNNAKEKINSGFSQINEAKNKLEEGKRETQNILDNYNLTIDDIFNIYQLLNGKEIPRDELKKIVKNDFEIKEDIYKFIDYLYDNNMFKKVNELLTEKLEETKKELIELIPKDFNNYDQIVSFINNISLDDIRNIIYANILDTKNVDELKKYIPENIKCYDKIIIFLDDYKDKINDIKLLFTTVINIKNAELEITLKEQELDSANNDYNNAYKKYLNYKEQLSAGETELKNGYNKYYSNKELYDSKIIEFNSQKIEFEKKIAQAKADINSLEMPTWYLNIRIDDSDYSSYIGASESIEKLANAFPTIFYVVAIFMSIMSMSRMALEDRQEIGTLKALGFSNISIMSKYIIYSSLATLIGGILGAIFGFFFLTYFVWNMYSILYVTNTFVYYYDFIPFIVGILIAFLCITGTTIITIKNIIKEKTASLLRPKAPKSGHKIFLEKIPLWNKINFSNKITFRNVFRYKQRVSLTIIGIAGCTVLLLAGYGIRDSVVNIPKKHFSEIMDYDDLIYHNGKIDLDSEIFKNENIKGFVNANINIGKLGVNSVNITSFEDCNNIESIIKLKSTKTNNKIILEDGKIIISSKLADVENINIGDKVKLMDNSNKEYNLEIADIFENYIGHYIIMNKNTYEKNIGDYKNNVIYLKFNNEIVEKEIMSELMKDDNILTITNTVHSKETIDTMLKSLNKVVYILIIFSGLLSFVVLYNLSYINISERRREIASLKVLGFYNHEVDSYIIRENFIITILGIIVGMVLGKGFSYYIVDLIEVDLVRFIHQIDFISNIKTLLFMLGFTVIVSIIIHFTLKKINMIDSLKSVE